MRVAASSASSGSGERERDCICERGFTSRSVVSTTAPREQTSAWSVPEHGPRRTGIDSAPPWARRCGHPRKPSGPRCRFLTIRGEPVVEYGSVVRSHQGRGSDAAVLTPDGSMDRAQVAIGMRRWWRLLLCLSRLSFPCRCLGLRPTRRPEMPRRFLADGGRSRYLPVPARDRFHTYVVHFIAGRTDGSTRRAGGRDRGLG